ncbi:uncharacterized protein [Lolium perenne]|uniref:uncharacterized protein n=1 Tax=Lolium perenne TaxID=4522 RepID=UPI0021EAC707|nr:E3 ubiquitin-protein ligase ATL4-like [Lolium perenne]
MSITSLPPPPERRVPLVVPMVPRLAEEGGAGAKVDDSRGSGGGGVAGISPSILIIAVIVVVMLLASISIHYFIRSLCRRSSGSSSTPPLPLVAVRSSAVAPAAVAGQGKEAAAERERLIERLPLFTLASSLAALPRSSRDCAVCQSVFGGDDELRLLPACRHAFHSRCVDPWLRANPSCPLCRASIALPHPPLPELLRVELGSVSSRRSTSSASAAVAAAPPPDGAPAAPRAYPLPSFPNSTAEYLVEEDLQVVLKPANPPLAPTARITGEPSQQLATAGERGLQPSSSVTPTASFRSVGRSSSRWSNRWSSRWSSGRWSSRYDAGSVTAAATAEWWWDMDGGVAPAVSRRGDAEDGSAFYGFVRWLTGAY